MFEIYEDIGMKDPQPLVENLLRIFDKWVFNILIWSWIFLKAKQVFCLTSEFDIWIQDRHQKQGSSLTQIEFCFKGQLYIAYIISYNHMISTNSSNDIIRNIWYDYNDDDKQMWQ